MPLIFKFKVNSGPPYLQCPIHPLLCVLEVLDIGQSIFNHVPWIFFDDFGFNPGGSKTDTPPNFSPWAVLVQ